MSIKHLLSKRPNILLVLLLFLLSGTNVMAQSSYVSYITNGDFEGSDFSSFVYKVDGGADLLNVTNAALINDNGNHYLKITSMANAANTWDTQFFINLNEPLHAGDKIRFSMRVKASQGVNVDSQSHLTAGNYIYWDIFGTHDFTTEWDEWSYSGIVTESQAGDGAQCVAFNLNNNLYEAIDFYFDDISVTVEKTYIPNDDEYEEVVTNGNFKGTDFSSFLYMVYEGNNIPLTAEDAHLQVDETSNRYFTISSNASAINSWDTQFFVNLDKPLKTGDKIKFSMRAKADKSVRIFTQANIAPGRYLHYNMFGNPVLNTDWEEYTYQGTISSDQDGCQTVSFNLNEDKEDNVNFCFDDISVKVYYVPLVFADETVEALCLANWDTNNDGKLSPAEVAAVTTLGTVFKNSNIESFDELKHFTGLTSIGDEAFSGCSALLSITIPDDVTSIGSHAFSGCVGLSDITIPDGVESIGSYAFSGCTGLSSFSIPSGVTAIGDCAFEGCSGLTSFYCNATAVPTTSSSAFQDSPISTAKLYVLEESVSSYKAAVPWSNFKKVLAMGTSEQFTVNSISVPDDIYVDNEVTVTVNITNDGASDQMEVCLWMKEEGSATWTFVTNVLGSVDPDESGNVVLYFVPEAVGTYLLKVTSGNDPDTSLKETTITVKDYDSVITNGDFEGNDFSSFVYKVNGNENLSDVTSADLVTDNDNHYLTITSMEDATYGWDTQFFIKLDQSLKKDDKIKFSMRVKASQDARISSQAHDGPGEYLHWSMVGSPELTTEWDTYTFIGTVSGDQIGAQCIAFNLNENLDDAITFYFDDINVKVLESATPQFSVNSISVPDEIITGKDVLVTANITNNGETDYEKVSLWRKAEGSAEWTLVTSEKYNIDAGQSDNVNLTFLPPSVGNYTLKITNAFDKTNASLKETTITVKELLKWTDNESGLRFSYIEGSGKATVIADESGAYLNMTSVTIPASVTIEGNTYAVKAIGDDAFINCLRITSVTMPEGIESIGDYAFRQCGSLTQIVVPEGVKSIGDNAFADCRSLQKLVLPSTLTSIGDMVVYYATSLSAVVSRLVDPIQIDDETFVTRFWDESGEHRNICH